MTSERLSTFGGKIIRSSEIGELFSAADEELNNADERSFEERVARREPIPFTGVFVNAITEELIMPSQSIRHIQCLDIFGLVEKTHVVVRIYGWRPNFLCRVPTGATPKMFRNRIVDRISLIRTRQEIGTIESEVISMPEFDGFQFGRNPLFIRFATDNGFSARKLSEIAAEEFRLSWNIVEGICNGDEEEYAGFKKELTEEEKIRHREENQIYPLRFTGLLSNHGLPYHFMTQESMSLVSHLLINDYQPYNPERGGIRYKHGLIVQWTDPLVIAERVNKFTTFIAPRSTERQLSRYDDEIEEMLSRQDTRAPMVVKGKIVMRESKGTEDNYFRNAIICAYDIETCLGSGHSFSKAIYDDDAILTIGMAFYRMSENIPVIRIALICADHPPAPLEKVLTILCEDEHDLLLQFALLFRRIHVSVLVGFNSDSFDNPYVLTRSLKKHTIDQLNDAFSEYDMPGMSRFETFGSAKLDGKKKENLCRPVSTQRTSVDAYIRLAKLRPKEFQEGASLSKMLAWYKVVDPETLESAHKMDLPIPRMYALWDENKPEGIREIIRYCVIDATSTYLLLYWINFFTEMFELSSLTRTTLIDSLHKADGMRVTQDLTYYTRAHRIAFMDELPPTAYKKKPIDGKIGGGDVRSLAPGLQHSIISLDYKSEYPAQKEAYNIGSSARVKADVLSRPELYGLRILEQDTIIDQYCSPDWPSRERYWLCDESFVDRFEELRSRLKIEVTSKDRSRDKALSIRALRIAADEGWVYEVQQFWAEAIDGGKPIKWKTYFVQSPRGANGMVTIHYSIQSRLLTDLRAERGRMQASMRKCSEIIAEKKKALQELGDRREDARRLEAAISKATVDRITFDMRQLGTKIQMNSEYGAGNSAIFSHFDQDVAATVTWCSRRLAEFLRRVLTCPVFVLPAYVVTDSFRQIYGRLEKFGFELTPFEGELREDSWKDARGHPIINPSLILERKMYRGFEDTEEGVDKWFKLVCPQSTLVYQDTDSNYYRVEAIANYFVGKVTGLERAIATMHALLDHNDLFALIVGGMVNRWPIAVSCDGGFVTAYWSPMKKQYLGVKSPISHQGIDKMDESSIMPSLRDRGKDEAVSKFLERKSIKVTGYQLIRRETPDYVIDFLFMLIEMLLCFNEGGGDATSIARNIMLECMQLIKNITVEGAKRFSTQQRYKSEANNQAKAIVTRLRIEGKEDLIPPDFTVIRYVLIADSRSEDVEYVARGKKPTGKKSDRMRLISELKDPVRLDTTHYLMKVASSVANLIFEELIENECSTASPAERNRLHGILESYHTGLESDEAKKLAKKAMAEVVKILMRPFDSSTPQHRKEFKRVTDIVASISTQTGSLRRAVKTAFEGSYNHATDTGVFIEQVVNSEIALATRNKTRIERTANGYIEQMTMFAPSIRSAFIEERQRLIAQDKITRHRTFVEACSNLIKRVASFDGQLCRKIVLSRSNGTPITHKTLTELMPRDILIRIACESTQLKISADNFRMTIVDEVSFNRALATMATTTRIDH